MDRVLALGAGGDENEVEVDANGTWDACKVLILLNFFFPLELRLFTAANNFSRLGWDSQFLDLNWQLPYSYRQQCQYQKISSINTGPLLLGLKVTKYWTQSLNQPQARTHSFNFWVMEFRL